jgi:hypothetical protein
MMEVEFNHLNHTTWECKYHVVFTPKYRKKLLFGKIKRHLGQVFHDLARRKECRIEEGHLPAARAGTFHARKNNPPACWPLPKLLGDGKRKHAGVEDF